MLNKFVCIFLPLAILPDVAFSQPLQNDSIFLQHAIRSSIKLYESAIEGHTALYNGSQYLEPERTGDKHPFFLSYDWEFGSIKYDGEVYESVPMLYDITSDKVVTELFYNSSAIVLVNQKIAWFKLLGHTFEMIYKESVNNSLPQTGFYDVLYDGHSKVVARRQKNIQDKIEANQIHRDFIEKNRYFIFKDGRFNSISNKASVLKLFEDQKSSLKQFIRTKKLRYKQDPDFMLRALAKYYDSLKPSAQ